jgi:succinate-semialdehyde dehydrogenase/glutarate-semialdehyde dehydrogenase
MQSINPYTGEVIETFSDFSDQQVKAAIDQAHETFHAWQKTTPGHRSLLMNKVAALLRENIDEYSRTITLEMGKPITESGKEVEKCAWVCEYYAAEAAGFLSPEHILTDAGSSYVSYEPLGIILGIMPWNFPFWQVFRFAVPTLMAGNTVLLKHASNVQGCARHIENIFLQAGFDPGTFQNMAITSDRMQPVIAHPLVRAVSLTGSAFAGRQVAENAGVHIKKTVLELGGSNAFIVLDDADLEKAVEVGILARMQNAGQSCIAAKRFILHEKIADQFTGMFLNRMKRIKSGDPLDPNTEIGPLASVQQAETVRKQVEASVKMGARIIAGGIQDKAFFTPTLLLDVHPGMPVFDEEVFGPVTPIIVVKSSEEAIRLANLSDYGLGVSVFTGNVEKVNAMIREFEDGAVFVNSMVKSDPRLPFGGTKQSGYGRELAINGIREFVNVKTVFINAP